MGNEKYITLIIELIKKNQSRAKEIYYLILGFLEG
jgi:hypothetical protein